MPEDRAALLAEAYRRGILPPEVKSAYEEAQKRGIVSQPSSGVADFFKSIPRGFVGGMAGTAAAMGQAEAPLQGMTGVPGAEESTKLVEQNVTGELPKPAGTAGKFGRAIGEFAGNPGTWMGPGGFGAKALTGATAAIGSEAAGQAAEGTSMELPARIAGGLVGAKVPSAAARTITPIPTPPSRQQYRRTLEAADIPYTAGQGTGSKSLQWAEGHLGEMPGAGGAAERANTGSQEAFNRWALEQAGVPGGMKADQATIDRMWGDLYNRYGQITQRNVMRADAQWWQEFTDAQQNYHDLVGVNRAPGVDRTINEMTDFMIRNRGQIPGDVYQTNRSRIERLARAAKADPETSRALREIAHTMDDAFERGLAANHSPDLGQFRELRAQYRNATAIEKAIGVGAKSDDIPPGRLRQALINQDRRSYRRGGRDMAETTQAADKILAPLPQSGTAPRAAMQGISSGLGATMGAAMGGPAASVPAAIGGALAPGVAGRVLHSAPVQGYLGNELVNTQFPHASTRALLPSAGSALGRDDALSPGAADLGLTSSANAAEVPKNPWQKKPMIEAGRGGGGGGSAPAPVSGIMSGISYRLPPAQYEELAAARRAGATKAELQSMIDRFSGKAGQWSPEKEQQYRDYRRGGSPGQWQADFDARLKQDLGQ